MKKMKFSVNSTPVIVFLALVAVLEYLWVENGMEYVKQPAYEMKTRVSERTREAISYLKDRRMKNAEFIDNLNDPNESGMIGQKYSQITTGSGSLPVKLSTVNPNFGALMVELLHQAGIKPGDKVAVGMTGSFPALDIEMLLALQEMKVKPLVIPSVTSSSWGANHPDYTILDMLSLLHKGGILEEMPEFASIGGNKDIGMSMSRKGRELVRQAVKRNGLKLLNKGSLEANISERLRIIDAYTGGTPLALYINIGGGVASNGSKNNKNAVGAGYHKKIKVRRLPDKYGVIYEMARRGIPVIQLANIEKLMKTYDLPLNPVPLPEIGKGKLYFGYRYNMMKVGFSALGLLSLLILLVYMDKRQHRLEDHIVSKEIQI